MILAKHTISAGDRFGHQGRAQLQAVIKAKEHGIDIAPVWNKSHREHTTIHTEPASVRQEADEAVQALDWTGLYYVDADHIGSPNVDLFLYYPHLNIDASEDKVKRLADHIASVGLKVGTVVVPIAAVLETDCSNELNPLWL